jgi:hypothetical protein
MVFFLSLKIVESARDLQPPGVRLASTEQRDDSATAQQANRRQI